MRSFQLHRHQVHRRAQAGPAAGSAPQEACSGGPAQQQQQGQAHAQQQQQPDQVPEWLVVHGLLQALAHRYFDSRGLAVERLEGLASGGAADTVRAYADTPC